MIDKGGGPYLAALAATDEAQLLGRCRFYGYAVFVDAHHFGEDCSHLGNKLADLRGLKSYGDIAVADFPALFRNEGGNASEKNLAVNAEEFIGIVGEVMTDVAEGQTAEEGIA